MCSMRGGGAVGWKVMGVLVVAMLLGVVEAAKLVRDGCRDLGVDDFKAGCSIACGATWPGGEECEDTDRSSEDCYAKCVRHHPHVLLAPPASPTAALRVRFTTWCCTRSFVC